MDFKNKLKSFNVDWIDTILIKVGVFVATLLLIKYWDALLNFEWYWYLMIWIIVAFRPFKNYYKWLTAK
jgi:hypothetical protein